MTDMLYSKLCTTRKRKGFLKLHVKSLARIVGMWGRTAMASTLELVFLLNFLIPTKCAAVLGVRHPAIQGHLRVSLVYENVNVFVVVVSPPFVAVVELSAVTFVVVVFFFFFSFSALTLAASSLAALSLAAFSRTLSLSCHSIARLVFGDIDLLADVLDRVSVLFCKPIGR